MSNSYRQSNSKKAMNNCKIKAKFRDFKASPDPINNFDFIYIGLILKITVALFCIAIHIIIALHNITLSHS